jgi:hypothetical protein
MANKQDRRRPPNRSLFLGMIAVSVILVVAASLLGYRAVINMLLAVCGILFAGVWLFVIGSNSYRVGRSSPWRFNRRHTRQSRTGDRDGD